MAKRTSIHAKYLLKQRKLKSVESKRPNLFSKVKQNVKKNQINKNMKKRDVLFSNAQKITKRANSILKRYEAMRSNVHNIVKHTESETGNKNNSDQDSDSDSFEDPERAKYREVDQAFKQLRPQLQFRKNVKLGCAKGNNGDKERSNTNKTSYDELIADLSRNPTVQAIRTKKKDLNKKTVDSEEVNKEDKKPEDKLKRQRITDDDIIESDFTDENDEGSDFYLLDESDTDFKNVLKKSISEDTNDQTPKVSEPKITTPATETLDLELFKTLIKKTGVPSFEKDFVIEDKESISALEKYSASSGSYADFLNYLGFENFNEHLNFQNTNISSLIFRLYYLVQSAKKQNCSNSISLSKNILTLFEKQVRKDLSFSRLVNIFSFFLNKTCTNNVSANDKRTTPEQILIIFERIATEVSQDILVSHSEKNKNKTKNEPGSMPENIFLKWVSDTKRQTQRSNIVTNTTNSKEKQITTDGNDRLIDSEIFEKMIAQFSLVAVLELLSMMDYFKTSENSEKIISVLCKLLSEISLESRETDISFCLQTYVNRILFAIIDESSQFVPELVQSVRMPFVYYMTPLFEQYWMYLGKSGENKSNVDLTEVCKRAISNQSTDQDKAFLILTAVDSLSHLIFSPLSRQQTSPNLAALLKLDGLNFDKISNLVGPNHPAFSKLKTAFSERKTHFQRVRKEREILAPHQPDAKIDQSTTTLRPKFETRFQGKTQKSEKQILTKSLKLQKRKTMSEIRRDAEIFSAEKKRQEDRVDAKRKQRKKEIEHMLSEENRLSKYDTMKSVVAKK